MSDRSQIEWTDATWNPVRGCTKISPGCAHCYAETFAERFRGVPRHPYEQGFDLRLVPGKLEEPLRWRRPRMIFVNSMSDLFHRDVPDEYILRVTRVMEAAPWLDMTNSESPEFIGRAVAALAADPDVLRHTGKVLVAASLAKEYGFTDIDGKTPRPLTLADV